MSRHVLITGAAGRVATILRQHWGDRYRLRLTDIAPVEDLAAHETYQRLDITQPDEFAAACEGIDTVLHLAADPSPRAEFYETLLPLNIIGGYNGFEAARQAGCRRIVFASSVNAVLGYGSVEGGTAEWSSPIFPQNVYGATKCWGEAVARVYADTHDLSCLCVRLHSPSFDQSSFADDAVAGGISPRDAANLFAACIDADDDVDFAIIHGVSRHKGGWFQVSSSDERIAFEPQDGTAFERRPTE